MDTSKKFTFRKHQFIGVKKVPAVASKGFSVPCSDLTESQKEANLLVDK